MTVYRYLFYFKAFTFFRRQASLAAVKNARRKAGEIAQFLNGKIGQAISVREDSCSESEGVSSGAAVDASDSVQSRLAAATLTVSVNVTVAFEFKPKSKTKSG